MNSPFCFSSLTASIELASIAEKCTPPSSDIAATLQQWQSAYIHNHDFFGNLTENDFIRVKDNLFLQTFGNTPVKTKKKFTFIDLFAGIGGMRLAAQNKEGLCVFSSEFDKFAQQTYRLNHHDLPFGDITEISAESIPHHDILFAGFPCQPFSYSGRNEGFQDRTRGTLFFDILRIISTKKPKVVVLENVKGFKSHDNGETMTLAMNALEALGYKAKWSILNSYDFGVPQYRERWYCIATLNENYYEFPKGTKRGSTLRDIIDTSIELETLRLPQFEIDRINYHFLKASEEERVQHDNSIYGSNTKKGKHGVYSFQKADGSLRFHVGDFAKTQIQEAFYACLDTYAPTIIANRTPKLWDIQRKLSVLESQRLQGFPDSFKFNVSDAQAYKQLGNSVSVPVIEAIIEKILIMDIL